jgi:hypothetical protein
VPAASAVNLCDAAPFFVMEPEKVSVTIVGVVGVGVVGVSSPHDTRDTIASASAAYHRTKRMWFVTR